MVLILLGSGAVVRMLRGSCRSNRPTAGRLPAGQGHRQKPPQQLRRAAPATAWRAGPQPPRGRTDAAVARRLLPAVPASANGSWPVAQRLLRPGCRGRVSRSSRGRSSALPRRELGRSCSPRAGRSRAAAASSNRRSARLPQRLPGQQPPEPTRNRDAAPARRGSGSCKTGGAADAARPQGGSRLGRGRFAARLPRRLLPGSTGRLPPRGGRLLRGSPGLGAGAATGRTTLSGAAPPFAL